MDIGLLVRKSNANHFLFGKSPLSSVEILSPEANLSSSHRTKTTSFRRWAIAEADGPRGFLLKTGLKSEFGSVEPDLSVAKSNWAYAVSSDMPTRRQQASTSAKILVVLRTWWYRRICMAFGERDG